MRDIINGITREDIYYIVVPIASSVIGVFFTNLVDKLSSEKQWKPVRGKSSQDKIFTYFIDSIFVGFFGLIVYALLVSLMETVFNVNISNIIKNIICLICIILFYILFICITKPKKRLILFKKEYKKENIHRNIIAITPIIISGGIWLAALFKLSNLIVIVTSIGGIAFEIYILIVLSEEKNFQYNYAKFYLTDGKMIDNISVETIRQKKNWIIATDNEKDIEYSFRVKDLERIEYKKEKQSDDPEKRNHKGKKGKGRGDDENRKFG